jgi:prophage tail gpP-like protein
LPDVELRVDGQKLTGWESVELVRSLEAVAGAFRLEVSDRDAFPIPEGAACELLLDGETMLTGWIDAIRPSFDARSRSVTVAGRDKTADLVDCSPLDSEQEFEGLRIDALARELVQPFGIAVSAQKALGDFGEPFERFAIQPGETCFEALDRAARLRGVLLTTDGLGRLVLEDPGLSRAEVALIEGLNILAGSGTFNRSGRYYRYVVRGQQAGSDLLYGEECSTEAEAFDLSIRQARGLLIIAETSVDIETAQRRVEWEAAVRRARGSALSVTVQGWRQRAGGKLWKPNQIARVQSKTLRIDRDLLVASTRFRLDARNGSTTELELMPVDAFTPQPMIEAEDQFGADVEDDE